VVRRSVDREHTVGARGEALGDVGGNDTIVVWGRVDALEEGEPGDGVVGLSLVERGEGLDDDVGVADDDAGVVDLRRSGVVVGLRVREETELHVINLQLDGELLIRGDSAKVLWENKLGAGEACLCDDAAHRNDIARAGADLLATGQGNVLGQAEVDEVVRRGQRRNLTSDRDLLSIEGKIGLNNTGVEGQ